MIKPSWSTPFLISTTFGTRPFEIKFPRIEHQKNRNLPDAAQLYMPHASGTQVAVSQGPNGSFSHQKLGFEHAVDFATPVCTPVAAVLPGRVYAVKADSNQGGLNESESKKNNFILIDHGNEKYSSYQHLCQNCILVKIGDYVKKGQIIGLTGMTGWSGHPHLHFQLNSFSEFGSIPVKFNEFNYLDKDKKYAATSLNQLEESTESRFKDKESKFNSDFFNKTGISDISPQLPWWKPFNSLKEIEFSGHVLPEFNAKFAALIVTDNQGKLIESLISPVSNLKFTIKIDNLEKIKIHNGYIYLSVLALKEKDEKIDLQNYWPIFQ